MQILENPKTHQLPITNDIFKEQKLLIEPITGKLDNSSKVSLDAFFLNQIQTKGKSAVYYLFLRPNLSWKESHFNLFKSETSKKPYKVNLANVKLKLLVKNGINNEVIKTAEKDEIDFGNLIWTINDSEGYSGYKGFQKIEIPADLIKKNYHNLLQYQLTYDDYSLTKETRDYGARKTEYGLIHIDTNSNFKDKYKDGNLISREDQNLAFAYLQYNPINNEYGFYKSLYTRILKIDWNPESNPALRPITKILSLSSQIIPNPKFKKEDLKNFGFSNKFYDLIEKGVLVNQQPTAIAEIKSETGKKINQSYSIDLKVDFQNKETLISDALGWNKRYNLKISNRTIFDPFLNVVREAYDNEGTKGLQKNPNELEHLFLDLKILYAGETIRLKSEIFKKIISNYNMFFLNKYDNINNGDSLKQYKFCFLFTPEIISHFVNIDNFNYQDFLQLENSAQYES
ncbi:hypothetical protein SSABA_v1c07040 [Spiroplasma sabaudiense Ar-1343]|uniref:Uncharacterized protein n=1 Tax=Spiroplasma sabaudiense Ar-1343 TaxID=1276257 RepID=W6AAR5_9MOLU|nr:hypothetical protein [Spiroplasma sabaudiense]AHI54106.1 hypothetical protein SSABA_v1c07040 [Spiroplasma sabaudiense Ar-1343]